MAAIIVGKHERKVIIKCAQKAGIIGEIQDWSGNFSTATAQNLQKIFTSAPLGELERKLLYFTMQPHAVGEKEKAILRAKVLVKK